MARRTPLGQTGAIPPVCGSRGGDLFPRRVAALHRRRVICRATEFSRCDRHLAAGGHLPGASTDCQPAKRRDSARYSFPLVGAPGDRNWNLPPLSGQSVRARSRDLAKPGGARCGPGCRPADPRLDPLSGAPGRLHLTPGRRAAGRPGGPGAGNLCRHLGRATGDGRDTVGLCRS